MHSRSIAAATLLLVACAGPSEETRPAQSAQEPPPPQAQQQQQPTEMQRQMQGEQPRAMPPEQQATQPPTDMPTAPVVEAMGDEQLVHLATVTNSHLIEEGRLAQQKATDPRVKRYAAKMIQDHTLARDQEQKIVSRMKLKPQESEKSRQMDAENRAEMDRLRTLSGTAFDRQYMQDQIDDHADFLAMVDSKILPNIKAQELKTHFEGFRPTINKHLTEAQDLQRQIGTAPVSRR